MITYLYWATTAAIALFLLILLVKNGAIKTGMLLFSAVIIGSWAAYTFHFEQIFVKNFGGVMSINMKEGEYHLGSTWKEDNLWIESYDPETRTCHFREFSKGNVLQGRVSMRDCRPLIFSSHEQVHGTSSTKARAQATDPAKPTAAKDRQATSANTEKNTEQTPEKPITLDDMPDIQ